MLRLLILSAVFPLFVLPVAGRWDWVMGWCVALIMAVTTVISRILVLKVNPDLIEERAASMSAEDAKPWDRILAPAMAITPLLVLVVASLDERFGWSRDMSLPLQLFGLTLLVAGYILATWAMLENRFFSGVVRIQKERGHEVVSSGPYAYVRHPGYTGSLVATVGMALAMSSVWAFAAVLLVLIVTVVRTALEDATLMEELPGYAEFANRTRYRLMPHIW